MPKLLDNDNPLSQLSDFQLILSSLDFWRAESFVVPPNA